MTTIEIENQLRDEVRSDMARESWQLMAHNTLAAILKTKWDNKKLNARLVDQFKDSFKRINGFEPSAYLRKEYGSMSLETWGFGPFQTSSNRVSLHIGYDSEPTEPRLFGANYNNYKANSFENADVSNGSAAHDRNMERAKLLSNGCDVIPRLALARAKEMQARAEIEELAPMGSVIRYSKVLKA